MLKKLINFFSREYIGIHLSEGRLWVTELHRGIILNEDISAILPDLNRPDPTPLRRVFQKVFKTKGIRWVQPQALITVPAGIDDDGNRTIITTAMEAGAGRVFLIEEFFIAALGAGVYQQTRESALRKKIFLLVKKKTAYLGLVFAGSALQVRIIPKGYEHLSLEDLRYELTQLLGSLPCELPGQLKKVPIPKHDLGLLANAWQGEPEKQIFIMAPRQYQGVWGSALDEYPLLYSEAAEEAIKQGLVTFLPQLRKFGLIMPNKEAIRRLILIIIVFIVVSLLAYWAKH